MGCTFTSLVGLRVNDWIFFSFFSEDCDCFGAQKKDEPNDKEKKEEEETLTSVHHSIIETWDWGRQPGVCPHHFYNASLALFSPVVSFPPVYTGSHSPSGCDC